MSKNFTLVINNNILYRKAMCLKAFQIFSMAWYVVRLWVLRVTVHLFIMLCSSRSMKQLYVTDKMKPTLFDDHLGQCTEIALAKTLP